MNGVLPKICTATALQQSEIVQQPVVVKATDCRVNILDHMFVKAFRVGLQCFKEMKGLGAVFNFYCGQTEIKKQIVLRLVRFGSFFFFKCPFLPEKAMAPHSTTSARDREAWWASIYGVAQSRTRLTRLSSSSSSSSSFFGNLEERLLLTNSFLLPNQR